MEAALRDKLYSLIEFALKCNLIFSEVGPSPLSALPQADPPLPWLRGGTEQGKGKKELCPLWGSGQRQLLGLCQFAHLPALTPKGVLCTPFPDAPDFPLRLEAPCHEDQHIP